MNPSIPPAIMLFFLFIVAVVFIDHGCQGCDGDNILLCGRACKNAGSHMAWYREGSCVCESTLDGGSASR